MKDIVNLLDMKYKGSFTLTDVYRDGLISENLPYFYVPAFEIVNNDLFIKNENSSYSTDLGPVAIRYIILNKSGKVITEPNTSYTNVPKFLDGFLARLSVLKTRYTPNDLSLDYFIDMGHIEYEVASTMKAEKSNSDNNEYQIIKDSKIYFKNIDFRKYGNIEFDVMLKEFILNRELIFNKYF